jgi:hypothetical protein
LTVIDLTTGDPVGETFAVAGELKKSPEINAQGTRAVITTRGFDPTTSTSYTQVVVFNPVTGQAVGATSAPLVM